MLRFRKLFRKPAVVGMVHVAALPGTPNHSGSMQYLVDKACKEAEMYAKCGMDSVMLENMHDVPYVHAKDFGPEVVSAMTRVCTEVRNILPQSISCGVQVLAGGNKEAVAVAVSSGLQFVRCEGFVFGHVADEGLIEASAGPLLRYRRALQADHVLIFTDIKKKHSSHAITSDVSLEETAKAAEFFLSDGVIITGPTTGSPANIKQLKDVKESVGIPVLIGSGITEENIDQYQAADGFIIGSYFKESGRWEGDVSNERVMRFVDKIEKLRN